MKKVIVLALAGALAMGLSACGSKDAAAPSTPAGSTSGSSSTGGAASGGAQEIKLVASNFKFDQAEYRVKKGSDVSIALENKEGLHGVDIKDLGVHLDNSKKTATFKADKAGTYDIVCAIPCGSGHVNMKSKLIVE
ncbi:cupredoxin domain-containing protein [Paenibacillus sp. P26]|nr:cupredoxin domain-containing protein [Paenibacillus sp. P26]